MAASPDGPDLGDTGARPAPGSEDPGERAAPWLNMVGQLEYRLGEGHTAVLNFSEGRDAFVLDLVLVPSQSRAAGIGSLLIERLLILADQLGKPVRTTARPIGHAGPEVLQRLVRYYERFGFVPVREGIRAVEMERPARGGRVRVGS